MAEAPRTLGLQRALAALVLDEAPGDPAAPARAQGLSGADQRAFRDQAEALDLYRDLARQSLVEPLETTFPVLKALLGGAGAWEGCVQAFLQARGVRSPHYRDIAPAFLGWLAETRWGQDRWPFLLELAHAELLEVLVTHFPESAAPEGLHDEPAAADLVVPEAPTRILAYVHAVHLATEAAPVPGVRATHLLAFRASDGGARVLELTPATAALLVQGQARPLGEVAAALGFPDPAPALALLRDLRRDGALAGFHRPA